MIFAALASFPGKTGNDGFDLSNQYDAVLEHAQRAAELGWTMLARSDGTGRPEVTLTDRQGSPLTGASVAAAAERPLGAPETQRLAFHETDAGRYVADTDADIAWSMGFDIVGIRRRQSGGSDAADHRAVNAFNFSPSPCGRGRGGGRRIPDSFPNPLPGGGIPQPPAVHCGEPAPAGRRFCCPGCAAAFETIQTLGTWPLLRATHPRSGTARTTPRNHRAMGFVSIRHDTRRWCA